jgi:hypothetical protein
MDPPLTTIAQPMREIGEGTVRLLLDILNGHAVEPVSLTLPHRLVIRGSTGPANPLTTPEPDHQHGAERRSNVQTFRLDARTRQRR